MQHNKSEYDAKQDMNSTIMPVKEPTNHNQNLHTENHASQVEGLKQEPCHVSDSHEQGKPFSSKNDKDSDPSTMQKPSQNFRVPAQESNPPLVANLTSAERAIVSDILLPVQTNRVPHASQSDILKPTYPMISEKTVEKLQPRRNPDNTAGCSQSDKGTIASEKLAILPNEEPQPDDILPTQCLDADNHALVKKENCNSTEQEVVSENLVQISIGPPVPESDHENSTYSIKVEKVEKLQPRRNPDPAAQGSQSDVESIPSKVSDKGSDDGYNWRKYGQKFVKGNEFIRSYYKCTYLNCQAKKQAERSLDGCKKEVNYLGSHHHPKPQHGPQVTSAFQLRIPETEVVPASKNDEPTVDNDNANQHVSPRETTGQSTVATTADGVIVAVSCSNNDNDDKDDYSDYKRQKREITSADDNLVNKSNHEFRHVVQTRSEVDIVNDGYRWRKYGQKLVKGNPNPRSYYRCSNAGCPVKKHVERASHDSQVVITTYEGQHDHDMPLSRAINPSIAVGGANTLTTNGESSPKPGELTTNGESISRSEENNPVGLEMVVRISAN